MRRRGVEVIARAKAALREYVIDGIKTNIPLHLKILHDPDFNRGEFATDFLTRYEPARREAAPRSAGKQSLLTATLRAMIDRVALERGVARPRVT